MTVNCRKTFVLRQLSRYPNKMPAEFIKIP